MSNIGQRIIKGLREFTERLRREVVWRCPECGMEFFDSDAAIHFMEPGLGCRFCFRRIRPK